MFRINPLLEFTDFETTGKDAGRLAGRNLSNGRAFATDVEILRGASTVEVRYAHGLKTSTSFRAEPAAAGSCLVVTEIYSGSEDERRARADEGHPYRCSLLLALVQCRVHDDHDYLQL